MAALNPYQTPLETEQTLVKATSYRGIWSTVLIATVLFLVMGLSGSIFSVLGLAIVIVPGQAVLLGIAISRMKRQEGAVRLRLLRAGIYAVMLVAMFLFARFELRTARAQAEQIVEVCHAYEKEHGHLPGDLSELVPDYLPSLPESLGFRSSKYYHYYAPKDGGPASFVYHPELFTRSWYSFQKREWSHNAT